MNKSIFETLGELQQKQYDVEKQIKDFTKDGIKELLGKIIKENPDDVEEVEEYVYDVSLGVVCNTIMYDSGDSFVATGLRYNMSENIVYVLTEDVDDILYFDEVEPIHQLMLMSDLANLRELVLASQEDVNYSPENLKEFIMCNVNNMLK